VFLLRYPVALSLASDSRNFAQYCVPLTDIVTSASFAAGRGKAPPTSPLLPLVSTFILPSLICPTFTTPPAGAVAFLYLKPVAEVPVQFALGMLKVSVVAPITTVSVAPSATGLRLAGLIPASFDWNWNLMDGFACSLLPTILTAPAGPTHKAVTSATVTESIRFSGLFICLSPPCGILSCRLAEAAGIFRETNATSTLRLRALSNESFYEFNPL